MMRNSVRNLKVAIHDPKVREGVEGVARLSIKMRRHDCWEDSELGSLSKPGKKGR
jgi:hypothetical protein